MQSNKVKKPGEENNIKNDVEMSRALGFGTDWFRSNVRVILQYGVKSSHVSQGLSDKRTSSKLNLLRTTLSGIFSEINPISSG